MVRERSIKTARYKPSKTANEIVDRNCRYRGTRNLESLNKEASFGSYSVTDRRSGTLRGCRWSLCFAGCSALGEACNGGRTLIAP